MGKDKKVNKEKKNAANGVPIGLLKAEERLDVEQKWHEDAYEKWEKWKDKHQKKANKE